MDLVYIVMNIHAEIFEDKSVEGRVQDQQNNKGDIDDSGCHRIPNSSTEKTSLSLRKRSEQEKKKD